MTTVIEAFAWAGVPEAVAFATKPKLGRALLERAAAVLGPDDWHRLSAGGGAKGPRLPDWAYQKLSVALGGLVPGPAGAALHP